MAKLKKDISIAKADIVRDAKRPLSERKKAYQEIMESNLNPCPVDKFDPATFDPMFDAPDFEVKKRDRREPPRRLPCLGMLPKAIYEGQMVGMYESKQDLYLLIAWLSRRVSDLEDQLLEKSGDNPTTPGKRSG